jgi:alpha-beta hydrolase superfamily lysophospholipase
VNAGIVVVGIEYEGHGRSDGPLCLIENWDRMVDDVSSYFQHAVRHQQDTHRRFRGDSTAAASSSPLPVFLMGESMGYVF